MNDASVRARRADAWLSFSLACWEVEHWRRHVATRDLSEDDLGLRLWQIVRASEAAATRGGLAVALSVAAEGEEGRGDGE